MSKTPTGKIRKVLFGQNPTSGMTYLVGKPSKHNEDNFISEIVEDVNHFFEFGKIRFLIYMSDGKKSFLWKAVEDVPVTIEYFTPEGKEINIV